MYTVRKRFTFEAAHRLESSYTEECQLLHGHSYIVEVFVSAPVLNDDGMVIDFKKLGEVVNPLLAKWDHRVLVQNGTPFPPTAAGGISGIFRVSFNPTAENMAKELWQHITMGVDPLFSAYTPGVRVRVHETATGWAEYEG